MPTRHAPNKPRRSSTKVSILPADIEHSSRSFELDDTADDAGGDDYTDVAGVSHAAATAALSVTSLTGSEGLNSRKSTRSVSSSLRRSFDDSTQFVIDLSSDNRNALKENKFVQELTINKLNFKALHVIGREEEIQTLQSCIDRSVCSDHDSVGIDDTDNHSSKRATAFGNVLRKKRELVFITGLSGIGKTALALGGAEEYVSRKYENAIVGKGKYSIHNHDEPYSGIAAAFEEIFTKILQQGQQQQNHRNPQDDLSRVTMIGANILEHVGQDGAMILSRLIPSLDLVISRLAGSNEVISSGSNSTSDKRDHDADLESLKYGFRVLGREICSSFSPVIIILDDLQWSDRRSMDVITYLLSDTENSNGGLTIIGLYRLEEVDDSHPLRERINGWTALPDLCNVTTIQLDGLSAYDINQIVMTLLAIDDEEKTRKLSDICFRRTFGNPFFLLKFIEMLEEEDLLNYNLGSLKWMWDDNTVETVTMSTENVVSILQARMKKLPPQCQKLIQLASCLGPTFHVSPLQDVWLSHSSVPKTNKSEDVLPLLDLLNSEHFLEHCGVGNNHYRFVHDKVQEAALSLDNCRDSQFRSEIGWILFDSLGTEDLERMLFDVADLVNQGKISRPRLVHASLNFRAAKKARSLSAFESASAYISRCISLLPDEKWTNHRELTLGIYSLAIEMEVALGRDHIMDELVEEVNVQKNLSCLDKIPMYFAKTHKLCNVDLDYAGTIDLSLEVLKELGCPLPSNPVTLPPIALWLFFRTVKRARNTPQSTFELPLTFMVKQKYRSAMLFLSRIFYASYFLKRQFLLVISASEMVRITLDFGISKFAGQAFASLGLIVNAVQGDTETSTYFAETALVIQKSLKSNYTESQTIFISHTYILGWTAPLSASLPHMARGFKIGMQSGNVAYAFWCLQGLRCFVSYQIGKPISQLLTHLPGLVAQMEDLRQREISSVTRMWWQLMLNLSGDSDELTELKGRAYDRKRDFTGLPLHDVMVNFLQSELCVFFGDYLTAADSAIDQGDNFEKGMGSHAMVMIHTFHRGVACFSMARRTRKRKYMVAAERFRSTITGWAKRGNPNVNHYHLLLSAEAMALKRGRHVAAESFYKQAIVLAGRTGHLHDAGLFNERYADFLRHQMNDEEEADLKLNEAIRWYSEWGASRVVERLQTLLLQKNRRVGK